MLALNRILLCGLLLLASEAGTAFASEPSGPSLKVSPTSSQTNEPFVGPASEAKKLYRRYKRAFEKTIIAIACVKSPKCIEPEDEVLRYTKEALRTLQKLDELSAQGDIQASYYRGLIAYERGNFYDTQAKIVTHPDFILTATVYRRYAKEQFLLAEKFFSIPAKANIPDANRYLGDIYSSEILGNPRKEKAANQYYRAAIIFIEQGNKIAGAQMYSAMKANANPSDPRMVEVYAKLHNEEPIVSWRKLPQDFLQKPSKSSAAH